MTLNLRYSSIFTLCNFLRYELTLITYLYTGTGRYIISLISIPVHISELQVYLVPIVWLLNLMRVEKGFL